MALLAAAGVQAQPGDPEAGKIKGAACFGCHGPDGNSAVANFPRLASQYAEYIVKQIRQFQTGERNNQPIMTAMAATVPSLADARDIGAYFQSQPMAETALTASPDKQLLQRGEQLFKEGNPQTGVYGCINCHGENGRGKRPDISQFPVIGSQHRDYLVKQLNEFRSGVRNNDPAGMMGDIAERLSDEEISAVAEYLSQLEPPPAEQ